jgi:integrase
MENIIPNIEDMNKKEQNWKFLQSDFIDFLILKELSESTIKQYLLMFRIFPHDSLNQASIDHFLMEHKGFIPRAFIKNYLKFMKRKDFELPEKTGRKKQRIEERIADDRIEILKETLYQVNEKWGLLFDLTLEGALRREEAINMKPENFDWEGWGKDKSKSCRLRIIGKGNKERIVIISSKLTQKVKDYISPMLKDGSLTMYGRIFPITKEAWWKRLKDVSIELFGKRIKPHQLRKKRATSLYEEGGFDVLELQQFLGHSNISTTQIYLHPDREKILKKFESYVEKMEHTEKK